MKNEKGVTLIALVITILVLIILAAVSVGALTGDSGIIKNAKTAQSNTINESIKGKIDMELEAFKADLTVSTDHSISKETMNQAITTLVDANGGTYTIKNGTGAESDSAITGNQTADIVVADAGVITISYAPKANSDGKAIEGKLTAEKDADGYRTYTVTKSEIKSST